MVEDESSSMLEGMAQALAHTFIYCALRIPIEYQGFVPHPPLSTKCKKCGKEPGVQHHCDEFHCEAPLIEREIA